MWPQRPADLAALSAEAIQTLIGDCRTAILAAADGDITPSVVASMGECETLMSDLKAELVKRNTTVTELSTQVEGILGRLGEGDSEEPEPEVVPEPEASATPEPEAPAAPEVEAPHAEVISFRRRRPTAGELANVAPKTPVPTPSKKVQSEFVAALSINGHEAGEAFESLTEVSKALLARWKTVGGSNTGERFSVARVLANFDDESKLSEKAEENFAKLGLFDDFLAGDDIAAAICAPREPIYDSVMGCGSSTARPVGNSVRTYQAPRGGVTVYPSPRLASVRNAANDGDGTGIWTRSDDANPSAVKNTCAVIPCNDSLNYDVYALYRCMTVKQMAMMTFPELVQALLNRAIALYSRLAEVTMLNAMKASVNVLDQIVNVPYGSALGVLENLLRTVSFYKEQERYDDISFSMWAPRQFRDILIADLLLQKNITGGSLRDRIHAASEVDAALSDLNINATWTLDLASGWGAVDVMTDGGDVPDWPVAMNAILSPVGNFRRLDAGAMDVGVAPGDIYRDNTSNTKNEFTIFVEAAEGIVDMGCTSLHMRFQDLCVSGAQPADATLLCDGAIS